MLNGNILLLYNENFIKDDNHFELIAALVILLRIYFCNFFFLVIDFCVIHHYLFTKLITHLFVI